MRWSTVRLGMALWAVAMPFLSLATHQVGGQIEMRATGNTPGRFRIIITNYYEAGTQGANRLTGGTAGIFRKRDNAQMTTFSVSETGQRKNVVFSNEFCSEQRSLNFVVATFETDIQLDPLTYNDPQGYYISYQTRNRNGGINNINGPLQAGFTFYLEFPPLQKDGYFFANSSPSFSPINGEYICIGEPFTFPFGGTDPDGDELRYSMVTPLNQKNGNASGGGGQGMGQNNVVSPAPYPDVTWLSGFSADNAIPGNPALTVNAQTGQLSVTATQLGLYVFAVKVEEYRDGVKIGEVRREFQFLVIDCPPTTTPDPTVQIQNRPNRRNATICQSDSAVLQATLDTSWNYQWRRDGINLANATGSSLTVRESGEYTVVVSPKVACSKLGKSQSLTITVVGSEASLDRAGHLCPTTGSVRLTASGETNVTFQWFRNGQPLAGQVSDSLRTTQPGQYWSVLTHRTFGCVARTDTAFIDRSPAVQAVIRSASGQNRICPASSLLLTGSGGIQYVWRKDGQVIDGVATAQYSTTAAGSYGITATDLYGCEGTSPPLVITQLAPITVTLDSIPGVCGPDGAVSRLQGSPPGGDFAGTGIVGNQFRPKQAGVGDHTITYTVKAAPECAGTVATRTAVVAPIPTIDMADSMATYRGNTFALEPSLTGNPNQFRWESGTYLDNPGVANPSVTNIADDITYTLDVTNSVGCIARDTIHITVFERVLVPDAFSPNGDGLNDVWTLRGIEAFPDAIVTIFNRWGEVIFLSDKGYKTPFNGMLRGDSLPSGVYPFTLYTVPQRPMLRGSLVILR